MKITKRQLRRIIKESIDQNFRDAIQSDVDYYEQRRQDELEELYLDDLNILKRKIEQYGAIDMQRLMGDIKKTRYLDRYDFDDIEEMLIQLQRDDEIDYDEDKTEKYAPTRFAQKDATRTHRWPYTWYQQ